MDSSESKALKALEILGFTVPDDMALTKERLESIDFEYLLQMKAVYKSKIETYAGLMDSILERVLLTRCGICEVEKYTYDDIPTGWGWLNANGTYVMFCVDCQADYEKRFKKEPLIER